MWYSSRSLAPQWIPWMVPVPVLLAGVTSRPSWMATPSKPTCAPVEPPAEALELLAEALELLEEELRLPQPASRRLAMPEAHMPMTTALTLPGMAVSETSVSATGSSCAAWALPAV